MIASIVESLNDAKDDELVFAIYSWRSRAPSTRLSATLSLTHVGSQPALFAEVTADLNRRVCSKAA